MPHLYLTAHELKNEDGFQYWGPPSPHVVGSIDARSIPESGQSLTAVPKSLFSLSQADGNLDGYIGEFTRDTLDSHITRAKVDAIEDRLGLLRGTIVSDSPRAIIVEILTQHADPTGVARWKPLLSDVIYLGGFSPIWRGTAWWKPGADPVWRGLALRTRQDDYRRIREQTLGSQHYKRVLDYWREKYRLPPELFVPSGLPFEGVLPHQTTITESFNKADADTLGPDLTWTEVVGDIDVASNQASGQSTTTANEARAESDLSSDDHYAQVDVTVYGVQDNATVAARYGSTDRTNYLFIIQNHTSATFRLFKLVAGSATQIASVDDTAPTVTFTARIKVDGSDIEGLIDGVSKVGPTSDTANTGQTRGGIGMSGLEAAGDVTVDNFEAADLAAGQTVGTGLLTGLKLTRPRLVR